MLGLTPLGAMNAFRCMLASALVLLGLAAVAQAADQGPIRVRVEPFISLPDNVRHPEGLTSNPANRDIYVATFDARMPETARNNQLLRYSQEGRLLAQKSFGATP